MVYLTVVTLFGCLAISMAIVDYHFGFIKIQTVAGGACGTQRVLVAHGIPTEGPYWLSKMS